MPHISVKLDHLGSGESCCRTSEATRVRLLNTEIAHDEMIRFRDYILPMASMAKLPKMNIWFGRNNARVMGTARFLENEIIVNRRCVQVFLHEFAHFITFFVNNDNEAHGLTFGKNLDWCIEVWFGGHWQ